LLYQLDGCCRSMMLILKLTNLLAMIGPTISTTKSTNMLKYMMA